MIVDNRKRALIKANSSDTSKLWALLRKTDNWGSKTSQLDCCGNVNDVNKYFTSVICDKMYSKEAVLTELHSQLNANDTNPAVEASYSDFDVMVILAKLTKTASGSDGIPYWLYRECASELSYVSVSYTHLTLPTNREV